MSYVVYPYSNDFYPLTEDSGLLNINICKVVYPRGWKKNICVPEGIQDSTNFFEAVEDSEGVIIADIKKWAYLYNDIIEKIEKTLSSGLKVICCSELNPQDLSRFGMQKNFQYLNCFDDISGFNKKPYQIQDCPVICVGNLFREMSNSDIVSKISIALKKKGYTVLTIIPDDRNYLLTDYKVFSDKFFSTCPVDEYVITYNNFINSLQAAHTADVIVIGLPDGMINYSDYCSGGNGIRNFILSQAISVDYFVLNSPLDVMDIEGFHLLSNTFKYRFGFDIDDIVFSRVCVDAATEEEERVVFQFATEKNINESINYYKKDTKLGYYDRQDLLTYDAI